MRWRASRVIVHTPDVPSGIRPTRAEIELAAVIENARLLAGKVQDGGKSSRMWAVVKANAYGHGATEVARALADAGVVDGFAVSLVEEGLELRDAGIRRPILVMGPALDGGYEELVAAEMTAMVSDPADIEHLALIGRRRGQPVEVHLKVDTGMGRLGVLPRQVPDLLGRPGSSGVLVTGLATHLACADTDSPEEPESMTREQLTRFAQVVSAARAAGLTGLTLHAANSAATLRFPGAIYDWVRPGLALYGNGGGADDLRQAMRLTTRVAQIRQVPPGTSVSYGAAWRAERPSRLAVLPVGYADGLPRAATGAAEVLLSGRRCPVVGKISMDISIVDVTDLGDNVEVGDTAVLLGAQGEERISAEEFARRAGLIEYEVTCGISKRVPREYV